MNDTDDDMPLMIRKGYDTGTKWIETLNTADVYTFQGKTETGLNVSIKKDKVYPDIENNDLEFTKGFNAAVDDYVQDHAIDWHWVFNQTVNMRP